MCKAIEAEHKTRLINDCKKKENGQLIPKTKTKSMITDIECSNYERSPQRELLKCSKEETRTLLMARYQMLECGKIYKGTLSELCSTCQTTDDEDHRLNYCTKYSDVNRCNSETKVDFSLIYSKDVSKLRSVIPDIRMLWNLESTHTASGMSS